MFTIIAIVKLNKKILNLKRQLSTNTLDRSHVFRDNNSNDTMSNFDSLNIFFRLSNDTIL